MMLILVPTKMFADYFLTELYESEYADIILEVREHSYGYTIGTSSNRVMITTPEFPERFRGIRFDEIIIDQTVKHIHNNYDYVYSNILLPIRIDNRCQIIEARL